MSTPILIETILESDQICNPHPNVYFLLKSSLQFLASRGFLQTVGPTGCENDRNVTYSGYACLLQGVDTESY
jgi:hypothetical protein